MRLIRLPTCLRFSPPPAKPRSVVGPGAEPSHGSDEGGHGSYQSSTRAESPQTHQVPAPQGCPIGTVDKIHEGTMSMRQFMQKVTPAVERKGPDIEDDEAEMIITESEVEDLPPKQVPPTCAVPMLMGLGKKRRSMR
mmetsp:Transcript_54875/g.117762  ORF Transcript_54875/g.117762 Transcript_54875/m.117762 type:complete len:137 (+) Transcript_54875:80-490(+)